MKGVTIDLPVDFSGLMTQVLLPAAQGDAPTADAELELATLLRSTLQGLRDADPERRRSWALVLRRFGETLGEVGDLLYSRGVRAERARIAKAPADGTPETQSATQAGKAPK